MASKADRAIDLISEIEEDARREAIKDVAGDLRHCLKDVDPAERAGWQAAIEFIKTNYSVK